MKFQGKKQNTNQKSVWRNIAIILGVIIVLFIAVVVVGVIMNKSAEASSDLEAEKMELIAAAPSKAEIKQTSEKITVTRSGAKTVDTDEDGEDDEEDKEKEDRKETESNENKDDKGNKENQSTESHSYKVVSQRVTWSEAKANCEAEGGYLATVTSADEYARILEAAEASGKNVLWLGAKRDATGQFQWITKESFSYTSWLSGEPNNEGGTENCLVMFKVDGQWVWADVPEDLSPYYSEDQVGYICEHDE